MFKLLFLSNMYPSTKFPSFGTFVKRNENDLESSGFSIEEKVVIDKKGGGILKIPRYFIFIFNGFLKIIFNKFDFIYVHYLTYSTIPLVFSLIFVRRRYFINIHGDDLVGNRLIHKIMGMFSRVILENALGIIVPSEYFKSIVLKKYPFIEPELIHVSYSGGIELNKFKPVTSVCDKEEYCWVGRIEEGKGWELLLQSIYEIKSNYLSEKFVVNVVGGGTQVLDFLNMVKKLNIKDYVNYHGELPHESLPTFFDRYKFFIFTTERESLGLVLLESLASGTPAIVPDIEPLNQIADISNSIFFKANDIQSLKSSILKSLEMQYESYLMLHQSAVSSMDKYSSLSARENLKIFILNRMGKVLS